MQPIHVRIAEVDTTPVLRSRWMIERDMPQVLAIDALLPAPWGEERLLNYFRHRIQHVAVRYDQDDVVLGYASFSRRPYFLNLGLLAVHPADRRKGVGTCLMERIKSKLGSERERINCCVPETEVGTQLFLKAQGFKCVEILKAQPCAEVFGFTCDQYGFRYEREDCNGR